MIQFLTNHWEWVVGTFLTIVTIVIALITYLKPESGVAKFVNKVYTIGIASKITINNNNIDSSNAKENDSKIK